MQIPAWRVALTGGAITILAAGGIGLVAAGGARPATTAGTYAVPPAAEVPAAGAPAADARAAAEPGTAEILAALAEDERAGHPGKALSARWLLRAGRHLVHAEVTITDREGKLVDLWLDHGTVQSIGDGKLVIAEAGSTTQTVQVADDVVVYVGRKDGKLSDVAAGAEVFVQSRIVDGAAVAKRILVIPADLE
jgi:hypothetical protein